MGGKIGVLVEVNCESDFVARTEDFQNLAREIAMHIAAANPTYVRREEVPADVLERERGIYRSQMEGQNKPAAVIEKIVEGKLNSFYEQVCLLDQPSIRDPEGDDRPGRPGRRSPRWARTSRCRASSASSWGKCRSARVSFPLPGGAGSGRGTTGGRTLVAGSHQRCAPPAAPALI